MLLTRFGLILGALFLFFVSAVALLLGLKAAKMVEEFRDEHHERFQGPKQP